MSQHVLGAAKPGPTPAARLAGPALAGVVATMGLVGAAFGAAIGRSTAMYCLEGRQEFCEAQDYVVPAAVGAAVGVLLMAAVLTWWRHEAVTAAMASAGFMAVLVGLAGVVVGLVLALFGALVPGEPVTAVTAAALVAGTVSSLAARRGAVAAALTSLGVMVVAVTLAIVLEVTAWPLASAAALWIAAIAGGSGRKTQHPACSDRYPTRFPSNLLIDREIAESRQA